MWAKRYIYESGQRVYSPNNKPTAEDVGALPISSALSARVGNLIVNNASNFPTIEFEAKNKKIIGVEGTASDYLTIYANDAAGKRRYELLTPQKHGTLATLDDISAASNIPVGSPIPWPLPNAPAGYFTCNGQSFNKSIYPQLAAAYPSGTLPDLRGEFIRGWDDGRGVDTGRGILSWQPATGNTDTDVKIGTSNPSYRRAQYGIKETHPRNIAFNYIVRAA
ncbi:hypothetical protein C5471_05505 [Photorhabdus tasmaniensis]|uniref:Phage tail collar domain-containing protein n=2 Tax=Photorhabdus tasmaniensis TaxID=1004159 RepID=A0ABX0GEL2_9GAMM|nr:hypothetical protein [Photorhabdus tasmaniensis]